AGLLEAGGSRRFQQAREAGGFARKNGHEDPVTGNRCGIDPGSACFDGEVVDEKSGFKIVSAVEDEWKSREQLRDVLRAEIRNHSLDMTFGMDTAKFSLRGDGLRQSFPGVRFVERGLPLEIGWFHKITVQD